MRADFSSRGVRLFSRPATEIGTQKKPDRYAPFRLCSQKSDFLLHVKPLAGLALHRGQPAHRLAAHRPERIGHEVVILARKIDLGLDRAGFARKEPVAQAGVHHDRLADGGELGVAALKGPFKLLAGDKAAHADQGRAPCNLVVDELQAGLPGALAAARRVIEVPLRDVQVLQRPLAERFSEREGFGQGDLL